MYCIVSKEALTAMGGNRGKLAAQAGHAFLHAWWSAYQRHKGRSMDYWGGGNATKITLICETTQDAIDIAKEHEDITGVTIVRDAGLTVFKEPTVTCVGIGPLTKEECSDKLRALKPLV